MGVIILVAVVITALLVLLIGGGAELFNQRRPVRPGSRSTATTANRASGLRLGCVAAKRRVVRLVLS